MEVIYTTRIQPEIDFGGIRFCDPVIFLTDLLMCFVCFWALNALNKHPALDRTEWLYRSFFICMGCCTFLSAFFGHLLLHYVPISYKIPGWLLSLLATASIAQASVERSRSFFADTTYCVLSGINVLALLVAAWAVYVTKWFPAIEIYSAFGLLALMATIESALLYKFNNPSAKLLLLGLPFALLAVLAHVLHISIGRWFSAFDIGHVLLCGTFYCFFLGAEKRFTHQSIIV